MQLANGEWVDVIDLEYAAPENTFDMFMGVDKQLATEKATVKEITMTEAPAKSLNSLTLPIVSAMGALCAVLVVALAFVMRLRASAGREQDKEGGEKAKGNAPEGKDVESSGPAEKQHSHKDTEVRMDDSMRSISASDRSGLEDSVIHAEGADHDDFQGVPELSNDSRGSFYSVDQEPALDATNLGSHALVLSPSRLSAMSMSNSALSSPRTPRSAKTNPQHGVIFPKY